MTMTAEIRIVKHNLSHRSDIKSFYKALNVIT